MNTQKQYIAHWRTDELFSRWRDRNIKMLERRAKEKGLPFDLKIGDMPEGIPLECPVLHIGFDTCRDAIGTDHYPTIDRIINDLGYVKGNIRIISSKANRLKSNASTLELWWLLLDSLRINKVAVPCLCSEHGKQWLGQ